jgi:hypothetical protein
MNPVNKRIWIKALLIGLVGTPLVVFCHIPMWSIIIAGTIFIVLTELRELD